jgi:hypothetical protein
VHSFIGTGFLKRFCQKRNESLELVRTEQLPRWRFFSEPTEREPLLLTKRKGSEERCHFFWAEANRMTVPGWFELVL